MSNTNFSTFSPARESDRLICVWVPTGNPKMPLTCFWIQDNLSQEDSTTNAVVDEPAVGPYISFNQRCEPPPLRPSANIKIS